MKTFGIDVSYVQEDFDFKKAKNEGVKFVIIRGAYSTSKDKLFESHYKNAKANGLDVGVYLYTKAKDETGAIKEAEYLYNNCLKGKQFELPIYIDIESSTQKALSKKTNTAIVKAFCDYLESKKYWVGVYSFLSFFKSNLNDNELQNYAHWVAQWSSECTYKGEDGVFGMWQFGGETNKIRTNKVAGVVCDQNYMLIDYPTKIKSAGLNGFKKTSIESKEETKKETKNIHELAVEVINGKWGNGKEREKRLTEAGYNYEEVQECVNEILKNSKTYYFVQKGDNLTKIAKKYETAVEQLIEWNDIENKNLIYEGQKLRVK